MKFALINHSTLVSNADRDLIARAVDEQLGTAAAAWGYDRPHVGTEAEEDSVELVLLDDSDQADALGYHDVTPEGKVYASIFARDSIAGLAGVDPATIQGEQPSDLVLRTVSSVVSHEALETLGDPQANLWVDGPDGEAWALELCDAVESSTYLISVDDASVAVSNFVHPAYFAPATPPGAQVDEQGVLPDGPFTIAADGYSITRTAGEIAQRYGDELPDWRRAAHDAASLSSRSGWRLLLSELETDEEASAPDPGGDDTAPEGAEEENDEVDEVELRSVLDPDEEAELERARISHPANPGQPGAALITQDNVSTPGVEHTKHASGGGSRHRTADR